MTNEREIVESLRSGDREALTQVYLAYRADFLDWAIKRHGCSLLLAKDVYQQTILDLFEILSFRKVSMLSSGLKTYIFAIGKNRFHELRLQTNTKSIESNGSNYISDDWKNVEPNHAIPLECVALCLNALDATSRAILVAYYYERQSMQDICERFGFNDEAEAKKMKYACLLKMKNVFEENISNL